MKIAYLKRTRHNSGGTERVVFNKTNYLVEKGYDVTLITTEYKDKPDFFPFSPKLKRIDLDINYSEQDGMPLFKKILQYIHKKQIHKRRLREVLMREKFDVVVSMFGDEVYWINEIKDGSKKINEVHFSRYFRSQLTKNDKSLPRRIINYIRNKKDIITTNKFDLFAVLSDEDKSNWGDIPNIRRVYNSVTLPEKVAILGGKRAIAVGRLSPQKGFDMLVDAWALVNKRYPDWVLDIYGSGDNKEELQQQIDNLGLSNVITINPPTPAIFEKITESSLYLMTSRYEGLPMVLLESNACGVPAVSFACKCGPRDIITDGENGFLVEQDDVDTFAERVCQLIKDESLRKEMGRNARKNIEERFSEEVVMTQWENIFRDLIKQNNN